MSHKNIKCTLQRIILPLVLVAHFVDANAERPQQEHIHPQLIKKAAGTEFKPSDTKFDGLVIRESINGKTQRQEMPPKEKVYTSVPQENGTPALPNIGEALGKHAARTKQSVESLTSSISPVNHEIVEFASPLRSHPTQPGDKPQTISVVLPKKDPAKEKVEESAPSTQTAQHKLTEEEIKARIAAGNAALPGLKSPTTNTSGKRWLSLGSLKSKQNNSSEANTPKRQGIALSFNQFSNQLQSSLRTLSSHLSSTGNDKSKKRSSYATASRNWYTTNDGMFRRKVDESATIGVDHPRQKAAEDQLERSPGWTLLKSSQ